MGPTQEFPLAAGKIAAWILLVAAYHPHVPLYEYECGQCGARFETLAAVGVDEHECAECGAQGAKRLLSTPAQTPKLVKTADGNRRQEAKNRKLHAATKSDFKRKRQAARDRARAKGGNP